MQAQRIFIHHLQREDCEFVFRYTDFARAWLWLTRFWPHMSLQTNWYVLVVRHGLWNSLHRLSNLPQCCMLLYGSSAGVFGQLQGLKPLQLAHTSMHATARLVFNFSLFVRIWAWTDPAWKFPKAECQMTTHRSGWCTNYGKCFLVPSTSGAGRSKWQKNTHGLR